MASAGALCWATCKRQQLKQPNTALKLEAAGGIDCANDGYRPRLIFLHKHIDLRQDVLKNRSPVESRNIAVRVGRVYPETEDIEIVLVGQSLKGQ